MPEGQQAISGRLASQSCDLLAVNDDAVLLNLRASKARVITQTAADVSDIMLERQENRDLIDFFLEYSVI